jgi:hypothetical protein
MDVDKLFKDAEPYYFFSELLPYLRNDLLPGLDELLAYADNLHVDPDARHGLTTQIQAMRDDLTNALAGVHAGETKAA